MVADSVRMAAWANAIRRIVSPGSTVLDIGTGTGIMAFLACQAGARRVYAIEPDEAIQLARQAAVANGFADRIEFIQGLSTRISLPERVDVIVSDLRGLLPPYASHFLSVADARKRFLATDGILVPRRDTMWACVVEADKAYGDLTSPWSSNEYALTFDSALRAVTNQWRKQKFTPEQLLTVPQCWTTIDYYTIEDPNLAGEVSAAVSRAGRGHGLAVWFECELCEGIGYSTAPGADAPKLLFGNAFFPWPHPAALDAGDVVNFKLRADLVGGDYVWSWDTRILGQGDPQCVKADFRQSTFFGEPISPATLRKRASDYAPALGEDGAVDRLAIGLMDGLNTLDEIARRLQAGFPDRFPDLRSALDHASELSVKYSK